MNEEYMPSELSNDSKDGLNPTILPPSLELHISSDKMQADLSVYLNAEDQTISYDEIMAFLEEKKITYGILHDDIKEFCETKNFKYTICVAKGLMPVNGKDAEIYHYFESNRELKPKERADGSIDFNDLDCVQNVDKDQILSYKVKATEGTDGYDVFYCALKAAPGKDISFICGENAYISEDGTQVLSLIDGYVEIRNNRISVKNIFTVKEDVDKSIGNLNILGSLIIRGDVREGFSIKAKGDIVIRGMAEGAVIESDGNISITEGMKGMNSGKIICKGDIHCKFIENAQVRCSGDVHADAIINSNITAKGSIILKSAKSCIRGGVYQAGVMIYSKDIGTPKFTPTVLAIASEEMTEALRGDSLKESEGEKILKKQLSSIEKDLGNIENTLLKLFNTSDIPDKKALVRTLLMKKNELGEKAREIKFKLEELMTKQKDKKCLTDFKVVTLGTIFPGVKINMAAYKFSVEQPYQYMKFIIEEGLIMPMLLNPADKI